MIVPSGELELILLEEIQMNNGGERNQED